MFLRKERHILSRKCSQFTFFISTTKLLVQSVVYSLQKKPKMHILLYNSCVEQGINLLYFTGLLSYPRYLFMKLGYVTKIVKKGSL